MDKDVRAFAHLNGAGDVADAEQVGGVGGGGAQDFEGMEAGFLEQFELAHQAEAVELEDEAGVGAGADAAAAVFVVVNELHPDPVVLLPVELVLGGPARPVRTMGAALGLVEFPYRVVGVALVPVGAAGAHDVAVGFVDVESGHEGETGRDEGIQRVVPLLAARLGRLLEHLAGDGEAEIFVAIVVVVGEVLDGGLLEQGFGEAVIVLGAGEAPFGGGERVHPADRELGMVAAGAQALFDGLGQSGFHDVGRRTEELDAVGALCLDGADPGAGFGGGEDGFHHVGHGGEVGVHDQVGRGDLVARGALFLIERPLQAVQRPGLADGGDAMGQPELVDIVGRRHRAAGGMVGDADMAVAVDEPGSDVFALAVDLVVAGFGSSTGLDRNARGADPLDLGDAALLDHDIDRSPGRRAGAVEHGGAAQHHAVEGADTAIARRGGGRGRHVGLGEARDRLFADGDGRHALGPLTACGVWRRRGVSRQAPSRRAVRRSSSGVAVPKPKNSR